MINDSGQPLTTQQQIQLELQQLKSEMALDFVALALADDNYRDIHWKIALGAQSERYKKITVRMGNGMAGKVLQTRRPHVVTYFPEEVQDEVLGYPIFLVESLRSGVGVSVDSIRPERKKAYGVLLIGQREERIFGEPDVEEVKRSAARLAVLYDSITTPGQESEAQETLQEEKASPLLLRMKEFRKQGMTCQLLDQRMTRLPLERQDQIAAILELLVRHSIQAHTRAGVVLGQDEAGNTLVEFESEEDGLISRELLDPVKEELFALKCDLEILAEGSCQTVRFTIPTRILLDEQHWN